MRSLEIFVEFERVFEIDTFLNVTLGYGSDTNYVAVLRAVFYSLPASK